MYKSLLIASAALAAAALPQVASASIVYDSTIIIDSSGQGFGNAPRLLTLQANGSESGCVSPNGGFNTGCISDAQVFGGNGISNTSNSGDLVSPIADNQKYGIPTLAELGWTTASDILLMFNSTEPGGAGNSLTLDDITLKFYDGTTLLAAIDGGGIFFPNTEAGNGSAGFALVVDSAQQTYLNTNVFSLNNGNIRVGTEATISGTAGGEESFTALSRATVPAVPEPATWAMMLIGFGAIGGAMRRKRAVGATRVRVNYA